VSRRGRRAEPCPCLGHTAMRAVGKAQPHLPAVSAAVVSGLFGSVSEACAADAPTEAPVVVTLNETLDLWRNARGGLKVGDTTLNKLQIVADLDGDAAGLPGWTARLQYFRTNGESLSGGRIGDIQTASNIEALSADRLIEAWVERQVGDTGAVRVGLMDLNADFDSIRPAGLFLNSSHGIAPDLSRTGLNGPSIFPVSSLGVHARWAPSPSLTLRGAVFDGVPGDLDHPKAFAAVHLRSSEGALVVGQADLALAGDAQLSFGAWTYTARFDRIDRPGQRQQGWAGVYGYLEGPLPEVPRARGWLRVGVSDPSVALVADYLGAGVVFDGTVPGRPLDQLGFAVARAGLGAPLRRRDRLPAAETTFEATYRFKVNKHVALQPDVEYVRHPASQPSLPDALAFALRINVVVSGTFGDTAAP
jgi:porin